MSARAKGSRTMLKARRFALSYPNSVWLPFHQVTRFATPQPFDALFLVPGKFAHLVEVRSNQWRVKKPSTVTLSILPGEVHKQIWLFVNGCTTPKVRQWDDTTQTWLPMIDPVRWRADEA